MSTPLWQERALAPAVLLGGGRLTVRDVEEIARGGAPVVLAPEAEEAIARSRRALEEKRAAGEPIYGLTTGFGALDSCRVRREDETIHQRNLLRSHAAGVGEPLPADEVRAMMVARLATFCRGVSGVRPEVARALAALLARDVIPLVPARGSVGAADLAPLAHLGLLLAGEGKARVGDGPFLPGAEALAAAGIEPPGLAGRDAFAIVGGLAHSAGTAALAVCDASRLAGAAEIAVAAGLLATGGRDDSFEDRAVKGHPGSRESAARLRGLLLGRQAPGHGALREPLSTRCAHHNIGALRDAVRRAAEVVETELSAAVDNPMIAGDGWHTNNAAEFHGQHLAESLDALSISLTSLAAASERRTARLLDPALSRRLPAFLIHPDVTPGLHSGLMIAQYTAAALVAELRAQAPASTQSIPTCNGTEDHVSMSALAARRTLRAAKLAGEALAIELLCAFQALDLSGETPTPALAPAYRDIRSRISLMVEDRVLADDIAATRALVRSGVFSAE